MSNFQLSVWTRVLFLPLVYKNNCAEIYKSGKRSDGVYTIKPDNLSAFDVFCDQTTAGGGWTVFQKRLDGSVDFYLNWSHYKVGFGDLNGEFWLGLEKLHRLTSDDNSMLRVDLEDFEGNTAYAEYNMFGVMSENTMYKLDLGNYSGVPFCFSILSRTANQTVKQTQLIYFVLFIIRVCKLHQNNNKPNNKTELSEFGLF